MQNKVAEPFIAVEHAGMNNTFVTTSELRGYDMVIKHVHTSRLHAQHDDGVCVQLFLSKREKKDGHVLKNPKIVK